MWIFYDLCVMLLYAGLFLNLPERALITQSKVLGLREIIHNAVLRNA